MFTVHVRRYTTRVLLLLFAAVLLWLRPVPAVPPALAAASSLYVPDFTNDRLIASNLDGSSPAVVSGFSGSLVSPTGIAIDLKNRQMYVANLGHFSGTSSVIRASLDGATSSVILSYPVVEGPMGLALDLANNKLYVVNYYAKNVVKADLDGSNATALTLGGYLNNPWAIALDTSNNYMYVTSFGDTYGDNGKVVRASLDGSSPTVLSFGSVTVTHPAGVAIDSYTQKMYITTFSNTLGANRLIQSNLDGGGAVDLGNPGNLLLGASGIAVDHSNQKLYIATYGDSGGGDAPGMVVQTNLSGGSATDLSTQAGWSSLSGNYYFVALDLSPDLTASLVHDYSSGIPAGSGFTWELTVSNVGVAPAAFSAGQTILKDYLPPGPSYSVTSQTYAVSFSAPVQCSVSSNVLTCTAGAGTTTFAAGGSQLNVHIKALTHAVGTLTNPTGGICRADPDHVTGDANTADNDCLDSLSAFAPNLARGGKLFVLNNAVQTITRANLDGTGGTNLGNPGALLSAARAIAIDPVHEKMYIADESTGRVTRANLDGTGGEDLGNLNSLVHSPTDITLDVPNNRMYVADFDSMGIVRSDLDGNSATMFVDLSSRNGSPTALALDLVHGYLYWTEKPNAVYRVDMNGGAATSVFGSITGSLNDPRGIAVDPIRGNAYITSNANGKVLLAKLDGSGGSDLGNLGGLCTSPAAIAADSSSGRIYLTCLNTPYRLVRANFDGSSPQNLGSLNNLLAFPTSIALDLGSRADLPLLRR